jgi:hypothetical protein
MYNPLAYLLEHVFLLFFLEHLCTPAPSRQTPKGWHHCVCVEDTCVCVEDTCVALAADTKGLASLMDDGPVIASHAVGLFCSLVGLF